MSRLLRAEFRKVATTPSAAWLTLAFVALMLTYILIPLLLSAAGLMEFQIADEQVQRSLLAAPTFGGLIVLLLGVIMSAGEYRHGTVVWTFVATPRRGLVLTAKALASVALGVTLSLLGFVLVVAGLTGVLALTGTPLAVPTGDVALVMVSISAYLALSGLLGVGLGALVQSQVVAFALAVTLMFIVEPLVLTLLPEVGRWLPGNSGFSLAAADTVSSADPAFLLRPVAALVYAAYALGAVVAASAFSLYRDVRR